MEDEMIAVRKETMMKWIERMTALDATPCPPADERPAEVQDAEQCECETPLLDPGERDCSAAWDDSMPL